MGFGDILGQMMQQGLGGKSPAAGRVERGAQSLDQGAGGIFAQIQGALRNAGIDTTNAESALGGLGGKAKDFLGTPQAGRLSGGQIGGIGAIAGALLGGGVGGAAKGGAMAILGTLALSALKSAQAGRAATSGTPAELTAAPEEIAAVTGPDSERLMVRAMISAAKADGQIDQTEMEKIIGKAGENDITPEEKSFILTEMQAPVDIAALAAEVTSPAQAAAVYTASLFAITVDTDQEKAYMEALATALNLDPATVMLLHKTTGAPAL